MRHDSRHPANRPEKKALRERTEAKPFAQKLRILEGIRERDATIRGKPAPKDSPTGAAKRK
jgi:hypothetical protein